MSLESPGPLPLEFSQAGVRRAGDPAPTQPDRCPGGWTPDAIKGAIEQSFRSASEVSVASDAVAGRDCITATFVTRDRYSTQWDVVMSGVCPRYDGIVVRAQDGRQVGWTLRLTGGRWPADAIEWAAREVCRFNSTLGQIARLDAADVPILVEPVEPAPAPVEFAGTFVDGAHCTVRITREPYGAFELEVTRGVAHDPLPLTPTPEQAESASERRARALERFGSEGKSVQMLAASTEIYEEFIDDPDPGLRELALEALNDVAGIYVLTGQPAEAADRFDELARRRIEIADVVRAAKATAARVELPYNLGRFVDAIAAADDFVTRFGEAAESDVGTVFAKVLHYKATALYALSRTDEMQAVFEQIGRRFADAGDPDLRIVAAGDLLGDAFLRGMRDLGATSAFEAIVTRFEADGDPRVRQIVEVARAAVKVRNGGEPRGRTSRAWKLSRKRVESTLASLGLAPELAEPVAAHIHSTAGPVVTKTDEAAIAIVLPVIIDARLLPEPVSDRQFAELLTRWIQSPGEHDSALQLAVARFADSADPELQLLAARALLLNGARLASKEDPSACSVFAEVALRYQHAAAPELRRTVAEALGLAAREMVKMNFLEHAVTAYERIVAFCAGASDPTLRATRARALLASWHAKAKLGDFSGALRDADRVLDDYAEDPVSEIQTLVGHAVGAKAISLFKLGRPVEGTQLHDRFVTRFGSSSDAGLRGLVNEVREVSKHGQLELSRLEYHDGDEGTWADDPLLFGHQIAAAIASARREVPPSGTEPTPQASQGLPADYAGWDRKTRKKFVLEMMSRTPGHAGLVGIRTMARMSGDPALIPALTEVMSQEREPEIRRCAARGLERMTDRAAIPGLLIALGESDNVIRGWAITGLGKLRAREAIEPLTALLTSRRDRSAAARALEQIGP